MAYARQEEFQEEFLSCSLCANPYDKEKYQPKSLPCLHTFCHDCLNKLCRTSKQTRKQKLHCPTCRYEVTLPKGGVEKLKTNFNVESLKEYVDTFHQSAVKCIKCDRHAEIFCQNCVCFMCHICGIAHNRLNPMKGHSLLSIAELQKHYQLQPCTEHPEQDLVLFCKNCDIMVCALCDEHSRHRLVDLSKMMGEIKMDLRQSLQQLQERSEMLIKVREATENVQIKLTDEFEKKKQQLNHECEQELVIPIRDRYQTAHQKFNQVYESEMKTLQEHLEGVDALTGQMISACDFANKACEISNPAQLLESRNQIKERLSDLESIKLPKMTEQLNVDFNYTDTHHFSMYQIQQAIPDLCDIPEKSIWKRLLKQLGITYDVIFQSLVVVGGIRLIFRHLPRPTRMFGILFLAFTVYNLKWIEGTGIRAFRHNNKE